MIKKVGKTWIAFKFDVIDYYILKEIEKNKVIGTINLAKILEISPKSLIHRLKKHTEMHWIIEGKVKAKPKGWRRIWNISKVGIKTMKNYEEQLKEWRAEEKLKEEFFKSHS